MNEWNERARIHQWEENAYEFDTAIAGVKMLSESCKMMNETLINRMKQAQPFLELEGNSKENENDDGSEADTSTMNIDDEGAEYMNSPGSKSFDNETFEDSPVEEEERILNFTEGKRAKCHWYITLVQKKHQKK